ncbi:DUF3427 domain-containing protein [Mycoplasma sp. P36-A1]|uniref:DUF3427 domain-containing protein n=1 Tax=Mycoplasma sp. P36-A1 TaxID=3252900 RepID=UPI003C2D6322
MNELYIESYVHNFLQKSQSINPGNDFILVDNHSIKLSSFLKEQLATCEEFIFCSAFLTDGGFQTILSELDLTKEKNIKGSIIIGNKSNFSQPKALKRFLSYDNIKLKLNMSNKLHSKLYMFKKDDFWTCCVGSSNLTDSALSSNEELNFIFKTKENGEIYIKLNEIFQRIWNSSFNMLDVIEEYEVAFNQLQKNRFDDFFIQKESRKIIPNKMQVDALKSLNNVRENNNNKALVISATGTGKTFLAAFDVEQFKAKKMLFIVHRERIIDDAIKTFKKVLPYKSLGKFTGTHKEDAEYIFCMINTISNDDHLHTFNRDDFDYIIVDEAHRIGAPSYQKVLSYFNPKFLLGLTATPERSDNFNVYEAFNYIVAYEIRLKAAIENELIVPFHYFGVSEVLVDGELVKENTTIDIKEKAKNIIEKSEHYGYSGDKVRALIFVDSVSTSNSLADEINSTTKYNAISLSGSSTSEQRTTAIDNLAKKIDDEKHIDYIITRDIFNEGIDIPVVNQVLLVRPTESTIVYIQQLGRGLRKCEGKDYLVVLDFIGNYKNNFLIPIALSGNSSYDRNFMNMFITNGTAMMPGCCTINFEKIARKQILDKIESSNFSIFSKIKEQYDTLKSKIGRVPMMYDFYIENMMSPENLIGASNTNNYFELLSRLDNTLDSTLNNNELAFLTHLDKQYLPFKRVHEILIIKYLLESQIDLFTLNKKIESYLQIDNQLENTKNALMHLNKELFIRTTAFAKQPPILINSQINPEFKNFYTNNEVFKNHINDFMQFNLEYIKDNYNQKSKETILLNHTYSRIETMWFLNKDYHNAMIKGYEKFEDMVVIFMKADKSSFNNEFISNQEVIYYSQNNKKIDYENVESKMAYNKIDMHLLVKKSTKASDYYLGKVKTIHFKETFTEENKPIIKYHFQLDIPIPHELYLYFTNEEV